MRSHIISAFASVCLGLISINAHADAQALPSASLPEELLAAHSIWLPGNNGAGAWYVDTRRIRTDAGSDAQAVMINDTGFIAAYRAEASSRLVADSIEGHFVGTPLTPSVTPSLDDNGSLVSNLYAFFKVDNTGAHGEIIGVARCNADIGLQVGQDMVICQSGSSAEPENGMSVGFTRTGLPVQIENNGYHVLGPTPDGWLAIASKGIDDRHAEHLVLLGAEGFSWSEQHDFGPVTVPGATIQEVARAVAVDVDSDSPSSSSNIFLVRRLEDGQAFYAAPENIAAILSGSVCGEHWKALSDSCLNAAKPLVSIKGAGGILPAQDDLWLLTEQRSSRFSSTHWAMNNGVGDKEPTMLGDADPTHPPTLIHTIKGGFILSAGSAYDVGAKVWNTTVPTWWATKSRALSASDVR